GADRRRVRLPRAQGLYLRGDGLLGRRRRPQHDGAPPPGEETCAGAAGVSDFRQLSEAVLASPQITVADIAAAAELGVTLVINNRPEGEEDSQTPGPAIEAAARAAGMDYTAIP